MNVAIYARQSVDKKDSISIESQIQKAQTFISNGEKYIVYEDKGFSGKNIERPDFKRLISDIKSKSINKVIVYRIDRISRNLLDFANVMETFTKYDVEFVSVSEQFDTSNPMGKAMLYIIMIFAQLERETIQQRIKDNYYSRGEKGFYLAGHPPYGFKKVGAELEGKKTYKYEPTEESDIMKEIFSLYSEGDYSLLSLCEKFTKKNTNGKIFRPVALSRMLRNPAYVKADSDVYLFLKSKGVTFNNSIDEYIGKNGVYIYGDRKQSRSKFQDMTYDFATLALHEGIIDSETWLKCQYILGENLKLKNTGNGAKSWLQGLMVCGECDHKPYIKALPYDYIYCRQPKYICKGYGKSFKASELEKTVEAQMFEHLNNLTINENCEKSDNLIKVNEIKIKLAKVDEQIENLIIQMSFGKDNVNQHIQKFIDKLDREKSELLLEIGKLTIEKNKSVLNINSLELNEKWHKFNTEEKKNAAKQIIDKIVLSNNGIRIKYYE